MASISAKRFYNGQTKTEYRSFLKKLAKIEENAQILHNRPLPSKKKTSVFDPHPVWICFPTQHQALNSRHNYQAKVNKNVHIFAQELSSDGKRQYIVTTYKQFWTYYAQLKSSKKNFYELIPEGAPCRLYFDLEFSKKANPDLNGVEILELFIKLVLYYLKEIFDLDCDRNQIIDLDSTTEIKFSRHLIFHLPNAVFVNNVACGNLMKYIYEMVRKSLNAEGIELSHALNVREKNIQLPKDICVNKLLVRNSDGGQTFFCDLSVYSRNRNFRILDSTKIGKNKPLTISEQNCFAVNTCAKRNSKSKDDIDYLFFINSLVCFDEDSMSSDVRILQFGDVAASYRRNISHNSEGISHLQEQGYKVSPFPKLDVFISKQISTGGVQGVIRRWVHFPHTSTMIYDVDRNHWCENIGRAHKSNHIYMVIDMKHGVFYQKCHDPDCQMIDYKSKERTLPPDVNPMMNNSDYLIDDFDDSLHDLIEAAEKAECENLFRDCEDLQGKELKDDKTGRSDDWELDAAFDDDFALDDFEMDREMASPDSSAIHFQSPCIVRQTVNPNSKNSSLDFAECLECDVVEAGSKSTPIDRAKHDFQEIVITKDFSEYCASDDVSIDYLDFDTPSDNQKYQNHHRSKNHPDKAPVVSLDSEWKYFGSFSVQNSQTALTKGNFDMANSLVPQSNSTTIQSTTKQLSPHSCNKPDYECIRQERKCDDIVIGRSDAKSRILEHNNSLNRIPFTTEKNSPKLPYIDEWEFDGVLEERTTFPESNSEHDKESDWDACDHGFLSFSENRKRKERQIRPMKADSDSYNSSETFLETKNHKAGQGIEADVEKRGKSDMSILKDDFFDIILDDDLTEDLLKI